MYNGMIFLFTLLVIFFNPHMAEREAHTRHFCPHTHFTLCVRTGFPIYTRTGEKFEEGERVTGPIILAVHGSPLSFPLIHQRPP